MYSVLYVQRDIGKRKENYSTIAPALLGIEPNIITVTTVPQGTIGRYLTVEGRDR